MRAVWKDHGSTMGAHVLFTDSCNRYFYFSPHRQPQRLLLNVRCKSFPFEPNSLSGPLKMITAHTGKEAGNGDKGGVKESTHNPLPKISAGAELFYGGDEKKNWQGSRSEGGPPNWKLCTAASLQTRSSERVALTERNHKRKTQLQPNTLWSFSLLPRSGRRSSQNECRHE